jgi:hypothetical protein
MKTLLLVCFSVLVACASANAFPTEREMTAKLRRGMTTHEVVSAFGQPRTGIPTLPGLSHMRYLPPLAELTANKEGYIGFEIELMDGRVTSWRTLRGNPSYAPMTAPPEVMILPWLLKIGLVGASVYGAILAFKRRRSEDRSIIEAYKDRLIPTRELPIEFRFITHETTVKQVIEKAGPYLRRRKLPIDPRIATTGYIYTDDSPGRPAIALFGWEMPFDGAVILMPEYPFTGDSPIRAAFYRSPRPEES